MKKIISVVLTAAMLLGGLCMGAAAGTDKSEVFDALDYVIGDYMFLAEFCNGYFEEGGSPSAGAIYQMLLWQVEEYFPQYKVSENEWGFAKYEIPAAEYEELAFTFYAKNDTVIDRLHTSDFYKTDKAEPYYLAEVGGGFGGPLPIPMLQSYILRDDGLYEAYALVADPYAMGAPSESGEYVPFEDDVEGEDYIIIGTDYYDYNEETDEVSVGFKYVPAKLLGGLKAVIDLDVENWSGIYHAYHMIDKNDIPESEDMVVPEESKDVAYVGGTFVAIDKDTFELGTVLYGEEYLDDEEAEDDVFDTTAEILKEQGSLAGVYEFEAKKDGQLVQPNSKIAVSFMLPNEFSPDCTVYYIAEDGTATALETAVDPDSSDTSILYATAELEHFSRYAVAGTLFGDVTEDGKVNLSDVSEMLKSIAKWDVDPNVIAADANHDGSMNLSDVTLVLKYIAGWDVRFGMNYVPVSDGSGWDTPDYVDVQLIDVNEYSRPGDKLEEVRGIVVHYVANPGTSAAANRSYFAGLAQSGATYASSNFIIGLEGEVIQCVPADEIAYASNSRNKDTLSIENCHPDETGKFTDATYASLVRLCADICEQFKLDPLTDIIRHHDVTGKLCPKYFVEHEDEWQKFLSDVNSAVTQ